MTKKEFDPRKFIDRDFERELFEDLLTCDDQARILAIEDAGGMGKSELLRHFQYRCRTVKPRTPVSLIALDQLPDNSPLTLIQEIAKDLTAFSLDFPTFEAADQARLAYDFTVISGTVDLSHADLSQVQGVDAAGVINKADTIQEVNIHGRAAFTPEQQAKAQETCVKAFLDDLKSCADQQTVVLMLDAYERCDPDLQTWLRENLLERHYFDLDQRPARLFLVLAGRTLPNFTLYWAIEDCKAIVQSIESLSKWTAQHVEECLCVHHFNYTPDQLEAFIKMIEIGLPPSQIMQAMQSLTGRGQRFDQS